MLWIIAAVLWTAVGAGIGAVVASPSFAGGWRETGAQAEAAAEDDQAGAEAEGDGADVVVEDRASDDGLQDRSGLVEGSLVRPLLIASAVVSWLVGLMTLLATGYVGTGQVLFSVLASFIVTALAAPGLLWLLRWRTGTTDDTDGDSGSSEQARGSGVRR